MTYEFDDNAVETSEAIEKLRGFQDEATELTEFAHFLSGRLNPSLVPEGFVMSSILSIYDLQNGVDGFSGEPIENGLVGLSQGGYDRLQASVPYLARIAFPENFADSVMRQMTDMGIIPAPDAAEVSTLDTSEIITEPIDNIDDAYTKIVEDAKQRVIDLEWSSLGLSDSEVGKGFDAVYGICLRNAPFSLPINLMVNDPDHEAGLIPELMPEHKKQLDGKYWLGQMMDVIPPEMAMFARDHIFLMSIDTIALLYKMEPMQTFKVFHSRDIDGPATRAAIRMSTFLEQNPDVVKR
ncbi:MAG: hypothetical protein WDN66_02940 [Candidatus Saccharibacteria bacterium]